MTLKYFSIVLLFSLFSNFTHAVVAFFPEIDGWELEVLDKVYVPDNLWDRINGAADGYLKYDFKDLRIADYHKGEMLISVMLFRHSSPDNTFGIYAQERATDYQFIDLGVQGYESKGVLNFLTGNYYVKLSSIESNEEIQKALNEIGKEIHRNLSQEDAWPDVLSLFPEENKVKNAEMYISENFIGYSFLHSAFTANYLIGEEKIQAFIIDLESETEADEMVSKYLEMIKAEPWKETDEIRVLEDMFNGTILMSKKESRIYGTLGATQESGEGIIKEIEEKLER